jgi:hypothetical protein
MDKKQLLRISGIRYTSQSETIEFIHLKYQSIGVYNSSFFFNLIQSAMTFAVKHIMLLLLSPVFILLLN